MRAHLQRRVPGAFALLGLLIAFLPVAPGRAGDDPWPDIRMSVFQERPIADGTGTLQLFAPDQANDAALVPVTLRLPHSVATQAQKLTLIIDRNPAPVAATITFGEVFRAAPDVGERVVAVRVRVDAFSRVRAVLERTDGTLVMVSKLVIGAGGCSAPSSKDPDDALASLGKTSLKVLKASVHDTKWREVVVMIKHPNFTGLQMDKRSGQFTPAQFVNLIDVRRGADSILRIEGGISISEDPNIRFTLGVTEDTDLEFLATDTMGRSFHAMAAPDPS